MEFIQRNFASVGFLLFGIVGFSLILQMPSLAAAAASFSCDPSTELFVGGNETHTDRDGGTSCNRCLTSIQVLCYGKNRPVSKYECNWWDIGSQLRTTTCIGCCGAPFPPVPLQSGCLTGDADLSFQAPASRPWDCGKCKNGCISKCEGGGETVSVELCVFAGANYDCKCCCKPRRSPRSYLSLSD